MARTNRRQDKKKRAKAEELQERERIAAINSEPDDDAGGVGGALLTSARYLRSDARLAAKLMSAGVVTEEQAETIMRQAYSLADKAFRDGNARNFCRLLQTIAKWPQLEIEHRKACGGFVPVMGARPAPVSDVPSDDDHVLEQSPIAYLEPATTDQLAETARVLMDLGILDANG